MMFRVHCGFCPSGAIFHFTSAKNPPVNEAFRSVLQVLQQVCLTHPPFPVKEHGVMLALIRDEISALQRALAPIG